MLQLISDVNSYQKKESNINSSRCPQFETIGIDNFTRVRTYFFRGWTDSYELKILTDKRSQKHFELESNNKV
tara:strand:- start:177 stop:392 length:216 start_codon:yes stop_codon:yes gene_type:complete